MKKLLLFTVLFAIIAVLGSCSEEDKYTPDKDTSSVMFNFSTEIPNSINQTKAVAITRYILEVYKTADPTTVVKRVEQAGGTIVVSLENNTNYICLFWADEVPLNDNTGGTYNAANLKNVTLNTGKTMSEAFFARLDITDQTTTFNVTLKRATAKVNIISTDVVTANTDLTVTFNQFNNFNTFTSEVEGTAVQTSKTFNSPATTGTLGTFLTFASVGGIITDFTSVYNSSVTNNIINVPLKANYITNIRGNYTAGSQNFTLIITVNEVWEMDINSVEINVGTIANPNWIKVADRNAHKNGINGAAAGALATSHGYYYQWSNATNDPTNIEKAHRACFDFAEGNGAWRLPTQAEWNIVSGNNGVSNADNNNRKLQWDGTAWKLYDERVGQTDKFVYFPISGLIGNTSGDTGTSIGTYVWYWSSNAENGTRAHRMYLDVSGNSNVSHAPITQGLTVRCVKAV